MRLLHICRQYYPSVGGVERFVAELSTRLVGRGHTVEVATLNRLWRDRERLAAYEVVNGIPVHRVPFVGGALFFVAPAVIRLASGFDILHIHNTDFFLDYTAATRLVHRRPFVVSTHGGFFHTTDYDALKRLYLAVFTRWSLRAAAVVIPNSPGDERRFATYARCAVRIDNAINYRAFASASRQPVRGQLITVGRLSPNKNVKGLLRVFAKAHSVRPDLSLTVVGDGALRGELQAEASLLGIAEAVRWRGEIDDAALRAELSRAEVFVSAAKYEGFGLAALEAMAAGVVPVVNRIEAFQDVIDDGRSGFLADYGDPDAAATTLLEIVGLPQERRLGLSKNAQSKASEFDWEKALPRFEEVYRRAFHAGQRKT